MRTSIFHSITSLLLTAIVLFATPLLASEKKLEIEQGWVRATPPGARNAAAFLTLHNRSNQDLLLTGVQCPATLAAHCEIHEHIQHDGRMRMQQVISVAIPANSDLRFAPGGYHIMLLDLVAPLTAGTTVELVFTFADQTTYHAQLPVKPVSEE